ncbi:glycosyltransferase [Jeotgalicoccus psychrophilus]|uniref:glycosyltransferase n=1 Tax=Jeotgalicoccus psychrophilus TaxID=157228 RepID=UPI000409DAA2|nr:glycosyltransferase [Jeotgalicoccus psychrophilus]
MRNLKKMIEDQDLTDNVFLRGFVTDLAAEFSKSHVNLLTSRMEGFSLALLEASSYGVPSVSYNIDYGPSEIIDDGQTGYLVPLDDEEELYNKVRMLLECHDSEAIYREVRIGADRYNKVNTGEQWMQLIEVLNK